MKKVFLHYKTACKISEQQKRLLPLRERPFDRNRERGNEAGRLKSVLGVKKPSRLQGSLSRKNSQFLQSSRAKHINNIFGGSTS